MAHSSRLAGLKDYISQRDIRLSLSSRWAAWSGDESHIPGRNKIQSWSHWAGQKIKRNATDVATVEQVHLFPGWAAKRLHRPTLDEPENTFDIVLHVSGFATSHRTPEFLTRSQRAFLKLARGFASIPKPQPIPHPPDIELQDYPERIRLPPRPSEISDDFEVESLDAYFRNTGNGNHEADDIHFTPQLSSDTASPELTRLHENLESRLRLFWASSLSSRRIQVSVFIQSPDPKYHRHSSRLLLNREMLTDQDGHFSDTFTIDWNDICTHPIGMRIASDHTHVEHDLLVEARVVNTEHTSELHETPTSVIHIPITHSTVRVISDIDDTVRVSRVTDGARAIFNQVFVKDLEDSVIPEMGEWYSTMWKLGVRFHYVSNCPFELLPVINQFIDISNLPLGSVRLRSYAGRSLFNGLLSAPANRKRANVIEVLDQFPTSQFLLVGDSGEQDLELYSSLAAERPSQIVGVFIRDVSAAGLEDPTGTQADFGSTNSPMKPKSRCTVPFPNSLSSRTVPKRAVSDTDVSSACPGAIRIPGPIKKGSISLPVYPYESLPDHRLLSRVSEDSSSVASCSSLSSSLPSTRQMRPITEGEKRRLDLQNRVHRARLVMPLHVVLRVFEDPKECVEAEQVIRRLMDVS